MFLFHFNADLVFKDRFQHSLHITLTFKCKQLAGPTLFRNICIQYFYQYVLSGYLSFCCQILICFQHKWIFLYCFDKADSNSYQSNIYSLIGLISFFFFLIQSALSTVCEYCMAVSNRQFKLISHSFAYFMRLYLKINK